MKSLKTNKKKYVRNYQYRLAAIKRRLNVELKEPEECLDILEKIVEKGRPVIRDLVWYTIDERFNFLIQSIYLTNKKRYNKLMEEYSKIIDRSDEVNRPLLLEYEYYNTNEVYNGHYPWKIRRVDRHSLKIAGENY